ncbi:MAG: hypothetical protein QW607_01675 [Desulfurococcaceae archaeon]
MSSQRIIFLIGYSQSGKSTRIHSIRKYLNPLIIRSGGNICDRRYPDIKIYAGSQTRHMVTHRIDVRFTSGETSFTSIDYTGQDHQAAYYFLDKVLEIMRTIKNANQDDETKRKNIEKIFNKIIGTSNDIISFFINPETTISKETFEKIVSDPFDPFTEVAKDYRLNLNGAYRDVVTRVLQLLGSENPQEVINELRIDISNFKERLKNILNIVSGDLNTSDSLRLIDLNKILCRIDTLNISGNRYEWNRDCDTVSNINIKTIGSYGYWRGIITGPLLMYLFLGLLINSWITIILMPSNFEKWYKQLKRIYIPSDTDKDAERNAMIRSIRHFTKFDPTIGDIVKSLCSTLLNQYIHEKKLDLESNRDTIVNIVDYVCSSLVQGQEQSEEQSQSNVIEDIKKGFYDKYLTVLWGEALAKIYHYELINVLLSLYLDYLKYYVRNQNENKIFIINLTYCEDKRFIDSVKAILSYEYLSELRESENYILNLRNTLNTLANIKDHDISIYIIPSTCWGGSDPATSTCSPFETISITCIANRIQEVKLINSNTKESTTVECQKILRAVDLNKIDKIIKNRENLN